MCLEQAEVPDIGITIELQERDKRLFIVLGKVLMNLGQVGVGEEERFRIWSRFFHD